jgi:hypothetical protein
MGFDLVNEEATIPLLFTLSHVKAHHTKSFALQDALKQNIQNMFPVML